MVLITNELHLTTQRPAEPQLAKLPVSFRMTRQHFFKKDQDS